VKKLKWKIIPKREFGDMKKINFSTTIQKKPAK
jgi:hypothetical protein